MTLKAKNTLCYMEAQYKYAVTVFHFQSLYLSKKVIKLKRLYLEVFERKDITGDLASNLSCI